MTNPFSSPVAPGAPEPAPRPRDLLGCLVAYAPREFTAAGAPGNTEGYKGGKPRDRVTADLIVLETPRGPVAFGGFPEVDGEPRAHHLTVLGPARFDGVWVNNETIVTALTKKDSAGDTIPKAGELMLGRVVRSDFGNKPFNLQSVDGTPDMNLAIDIYNRLSMGQLQYNAPQPIPGVPVPQRTTASQPGTLPPPMPPAATQYAPNPVPPQATAWTTPPPPAPPAPAAPVVDPAYAAWQAQQAIANGFPGTTPVPQPPAPPVNPNAMPPHLAAVGWTAASWGPLTPEQKSQVLAATPAPVSAPTPF